MIYDTDNHDAEVKNNTSSSSPSSSSLWFYKVSFALFCLYVLYETNPLPKGPTNDDLTNTTNKEQEILSMLPLGIHHGANAMKKLYRRCFKFKIRIDPFHYIMLQRIRDLCYSTISHCQLHWCHSQMTILQRKEEQFKGNDDDDDGQEDNMLNTRQQSLQQEEQYQNKSSSQASSSSIWSCVCGLSKDIVHVIDKMLNNDSFEMCQYTGPCGLEALAGHEDYP